MPITVSRASATTVSFTAPQEIVINKDDDSITAHQGGSWTVAVNNFPAVQPVSGTVAVSNFPAVQPVSGTVTVNQPVTVTWPTDRPVADAELRKTDVLILHSRVTFNTSVAVLAVSGTLHTSTRYITVFNHGNSVLYYGSQTTLTSSATNGIPIKKNEWAKLPCKQGFSLYCRCGSGSASLTVIEWGYA